MKYKLLCIDIDGALLDDQKRLQPQVVEALREQERQGIQIALISGNYSVKAVDFVNESAAFVFGELPVE